jgi:predicted metal-dependent enzyme (double-stranded beta helix superfamily)
MNNLTINALDNQALQTLKSRHVKTWNASSGAYTMFDLDRFTADCRAARAADHSSKTICEVVRRAVSDPAALLKSLGEPDRAGIKEIYRSPDLSILNVVWAPRMMIMPHNHHMWAVIGVYGGREDNIFWRRIAEAGEGQLEAAGARSLAVRDAQPLGHDIIHSVTNPTSKFTAAIHVYGGDFFAAHRSEWDSDTLSEHPSDGNRARQIFEEANRRYAAGLS